MFNYGVYVAPRISTEYFRHAGKCGLRANDQEKLLHLLRDVAFASSSQDLKVKLNNLVQSVLYKTNENVKKYFERHWLLCKKVNEIIHIYVPLVICLFAALVLCFSKTRLSYFRSYKQRRRGNESFIQVLSLQLADG